MPNKSPKKTKKSNKKIYYPEYGLGGTLGAVLGQSLIPVPGLGAAVGKFAGTGIENLIQGEEFAPAFGFKNGGALNYIEGDSHEDPSGGVQMGNNMVEGGETKFNNQEEEYIFSDEFPKKQTFAQKSKKIDKKYSKRPHDKWSNQAKQKELEQLKQEQVQYQIENNIMPGGGTFRNEGKMKNVYQNGGPYKFGTEDFGGGEFGGRIIPQNFIQGYLSQNPDADISQPNPDLESSFIDHLESYGALEDYAQLPNTQVPQARPIVDTQINPQMPTTDIRAEDNLPTEEGSQQDFNFGRQAGNVLLEGGLNNIGNLAYLIGEGKDYDKVDYGQIDPNLISADESIRDTERSFNKARTGLRESGTTSGARYRANLSALATGESSQKAKIREAVNNANSQIKNKTNQFNKQTEIAAQVAEDQNKGVADTNFYNALSGIGTNFASTIRDQKLRNNQQKTLSALELMYPNANLDLSDIYNPPS